MSEERRQPNNRVESRCVRTRNRYRSRRGDSRQTERHGAPHQDSDRTCGRRDCRRRGESYSRRRSSARRLGRRQHHAAGGPVVSAFVADDRGAARVFVAGGGRCGHWRHSQTRARWSEVVCLLPRDLSDLGRRSESRSPTQSGPASGSIRQLPLRLQQRYATDATKTVEAAKQASSTSEAADAGGGNDRSEEPVLSRCAGKEDREHASPHVLRVGDRHRDHAASGNCDGAVAARARRSLRDHGEDHRDDHEVCAVRGGVFALQQHRAFRSGSVAGARRGLS